jgi:uncharacterized protein YaaQ
MTQSSPGDQTESVDQLVLVVVNDEQAGQLGKKLVAQGFRFTLITASSGLLLAGTTCLLLGIHSGRNPALMGLIESVCKTRRTFIPALGQMGLPEGMPLHMIEAEVGSAAVYILPVETYLVF